MAGPAAPLLDSAVAVVETPPVTPRGYHTHMDQHPMRAATPSSHDLEAVILSVLAKQPMRGAALLEHLAGHGEKEVRRGMWRLLDSGKIVLGWDCRLRVVANSAPTAQNAASLSSAASE